MCAYVSGMDAELHRAGEKPNASGGYCRPITDTNAIPGNIHTFTNGGFERNSARSRQWWQTTLVAGWYLSEGKAEWKPGNLTLVS